MTLLLLGTAFIGLGVAIRSWWTFVNELPKASIVRSQHIFEILFPMLHDEHPFMLGARDVTLSRTARQLRKRLALL